MRLKTSEIAKKLLQGSSYIELRRILHKRVTSTTVSWVNKGAKNRNPSSKFSQPIGHYCWSTRPWFRMWAQWSRCSSSSSPQLKWSIMSDDFRGGLKGGSKSTAQWKSFSKEPFMGTPERLLTIVTVWYSLLLNKTYVQCSCSGWPTGNGKKLSNSQACCLVQLCQAPA